MNVEMDVASADSVAEISQPLTCASPAAIRHHYDVSNEFYELWLGPTLTYSCAHWQPHDTLLDAQLRKLDLLIDMAHASAQSRVLDIGCGWGSCLTRLVEDHGVAQATGLTISDAHAGYIQGFGNPNVEVCTESWRDHMPAAPYDAIVSLEAFEHFARPGSHEAKMAGYRAFFQKCHDMLVEGGHLGLQTITTGDAPLTTTDFNDLLFMGREVFPESILARPIEIVDAIRGQFEIVLLRNDRSDYIRTCDHWFHQLQEHRSEALALVGEEIVQRFERYLSAAARMFRTGHVYLLRMSLRRVG
jgi:cyclopropane-fatty-acyl-phospholipid synthase